MNEKGCAACRGTRLPWDRAIRLGAYEGGLRDGVIGCKYRGDRESGIRLGRLLGARVAEAAVEVADRMVGRERASVGMDAGSVVVVPVPTTYLRRRVNAGVDHALVLAREVAGVLGTRTDRLLRRRHGARQAARTAAERARQVKGVFSPRLGMVPGGGSRSGTGGVQVVVLVDDVRTTGATASACMGVLREMFEGDGGRSRRRSGGGRARGRVGFVLATAAVSDRRRGGGDRVGGWGGEETAFLERESGW